MRLCIVGLGRVGLPTAVLAARAGHEVTGVERDPRRLASIASGEAGDPEPGLREALRATPIAVSPAVVAADAYVVCVATPWDGRAADTADVQVAVAAVADAAPDGALVVIESTVPVGTTEALAARAPSLRFAVAPERVLPGDALREIARNPRVVGGDPAAAALLATWCHGPIDLVEPRMAELAKLVENASRDVEIAFANTVAAVAGRWGVDPWALQRVVNGHPRARMATPGIGVGGHCLPVDPWFLVAAAPAETALLRAAREVNDLGPERAVAEVARHAGTIGLLGLAYKPDTDDVRNAPAVRVALALSASRDVLAADPYVTVPGVRAATVERILRRDVVVLLVAHSAYRGLKARVRGIPVDLCGGWS